MKIIKVKNYKELSEKAAELVFKEIKKKPNLVLGCAIGKTPKGLYKNLVKEYKKKKVDFSKVKTFNLDEYYGIRKKDERSYFNYMFKRLFSKINLKKSNINMLNGEVEDWKKECLRYEKKIRENPINFQILGIGVNGHIAFNEPGSEFNSRTRLVNLTRETRTRNYKLGMKVPEQALTIGIKMIMKSKKIVLLASGRSKRKAIRALIKGSISKKWPVTALKKHKNFTLIVDKKALGKV